jgi:hypothetical protein
VLDRLTVDRPSLEDVYLSLTDGNATTADPTGPAGDRAAGASAATVSQTVAASEGNTA